MFYLALFFVALFILGSLLLLLNEVGKQSKIKKKVTRKSKSVKSPPKNWTIETNSIQDRARLRSQSQRTGRKLPPSVQGTSITPQSFPIPAPLAPTPPQEPAVPDYFIPPPHFQKQGVRREPTQEYPRLVSLLNGDRKGANRLVQNLLDMYPDKSEYWCYEKACSDLTRDRH